MIKYLFIIGLVLTSGLSIDVGHAHNLRRAHQYSLEHNVPLKHLSKSKQCGNRIAVDVGVYEMGWTQATHESTTVYLQNTFTNPIVLIGSPTDRGPHAFTMKVTDVQPTQFTFNIEEWAQMDVWHTTEYMSYAVFEAGTFEFSDGTRYQAGTLDVGGDFTYVANSAGHFSGNTVSFTQLVSNSNPTPYETQINQEDGGFSVRLSAEAARTVSSIETVHYVTIGEALIEDDNSLQNHVTTYQADEEEFEVDFGYNENENMPFFFAQMQTTNSNNSGGVRYRYLEYDYAELWIQWERDAVNGFQDEIVGYAAFW